MIKISSQKQQKVLLYLPLIIIETYLCFTLFLFEFGTIQWPVSNRATLYTFLILYHLSFIFGYVLIMKKRNSANYHFLKNFRKKMIKQFNRIREYFVVACKKYFKYYIYLGLIILLAINYFRLGRVVNSLNPIDIFQYVYYGIFNSYELYKLKFLLDQNTLIGGRLVTIMTTALSPIYWPIYPLCFFYFKKLKKSQKFLFCLAILFEVSYGISIGTNKVIFDIVVIGFVTSLVKHLQKDYYEGINFKKTIFAFLTLIGMVVLILIFFNFTMLSRLGGMERFNMGFMDGIPVNVDNSIFKYFPESILFLLTMLSSYLTQGYFGMSLALKLPFKWTYGLGNNNFILSNIEELIDLGVRSNLYQNRIQEFSWNATKNWHTMYTWLANDVSFFGVIIVMFILGIVFALVWRDVLENKNIFAMCLMPLYFILFFFIPCNNQVFSLPTTFMPFIFLTFLWFLTRKKGSVYG